MNMIIGRQFVNYQEEERLYSTGSDELDAMLERAFCEGYEYAQREFASVKAQRLVNNFGKNASKDLGTLATKVGKNPKAALGIAAGLTAAGTAGAIMRSKRDRRKGWEDAKMGVQRTAKY